MIHQMDVVTAFLNGYLEEEVYMQQPEGFIKPGEEHLVCKLKKSLYGLKQSPRCWNKVFHEYLISLGFIQSQADSCVYIRGKHIIAVYVDGLILLTNTEEDMNNIKESLTKKFKMKDMGELHYCLGISMEYERGKWLKIHQTQYILNILGKYGFASANTVATPEDPSVKLKKDDGVSKYLSDPVK